jgi:hypothetical protein
LVAASLIWHAISDAFVRLIRITTRTDGDHAVVIIDGRATETDLKEIARVRETITGAVVLNLRGLDICVPAGIRLLRGWLDSGARLQGATPFLEMALKDPPT